MESPLICIVVARQPRKKDTIKVRITEREGDGAEVSYGWKIETPLEQTHLPPGTSELRFGPEHVATVYVRK